MRIVRRLRIKKYLIFNFWLIIDEDFINRFAHGSSIGFSWPQRLPNDLSVFKSIQWSKYKSIMEKNINGPNS
jgi:hypothetical protein